MWMWMRMWMRMRMRMRVLRPDSFACNSQHLTTNQSHSYTVYLLIYIILIKRLQGRLKTSTATTVCDPTCDVNHDITKKALKTPLELDSLLQSHYPVFAARYFASLYSRSIQCTTVFSATELQDDPIQYAVRYSFSCNGTITQYDTVYSLLQYTQCSRIHSAFQRNTIQYSIQCSIVYSATELQCNTIQYNTIQYIVQYTTQCSMLHCAIYYIVQYTQCSILHCAIYYIVITIYIVLYSTVHNAVQYIV